MKTKPKQPTDKKSIKCPKCNNIYTVKNVKTFQGMEGQGFNASLYRDGKKVAFVIDSAHGGDYNYQWVDWKKPKVGINITTTLEMPHTFNGTPEEKIFYEHLETLPKEPGTKDFPKELKVSNDIFISKLVDTYESKKWLKRQLKKRYLFQIGNEIGGTSYQSFSKRGNLTRDDVIALIENRYPNKKYVLMEE